MLPVSVASTGKSNSSGLSRSSEDAQIWMEWKKQLTAYVAWVNSQLRKKPGAHLIEDLRHDIRDGVAMIDLIEVIAGEMLPDVHRAPSTLAEMRENVDKILQFTVQKKIKMHHITTRDIVEGNLKAIMRLILALAAHFKPNSVRHSSQTDRQNITGIAQGAAAALTEARRNATRAGHRHRRRRHREESTKHSDRRVVSEGDHSDKQTHLASGAGEIDEISGNSSPMSSRNTSPRASLYLSDPPSSMEGLLMASGSIYKGSVMVTSCESDTAMGDSGYSEICDNLKETHQMLFQLHDLLLNGDGTEEVGSLSGEVVEGANPKETVIILKSRLLNAEEVAETLRSDLTKVKKDCLELQGTKAGLQQRLKDQESNLSTLKSEVMRLELEKEKLILEIEAMKKLLTEKDQALSDVRTSSFKQMELKDKIISDLKKELMRKDHTIEQMQEQLEKVGAVEAKEKSTAIASDAKYMKQARDAELSYHRISRLTECLNKITGHTKLTHLKSSDFESVKDAILQVRAHVSEQDQSNTALGCLEVAVVKLLDKLPINGVTVGTPSLPGSQNLSKERNATTPGKRAANVSQNWRQSGNRETTKAFQKTRAQNSLSSSSGAWTTPPRSTAPRNEVSNRSYQNSPRMPVGTPSVNRSVLGSSASKVPRSQIPRPQGTGTKMKSAMTISDVQTSVMYYIGQSDVHISCVIGKKLGEVRLRDFKSVIEDSNLYHYFFKAADSEQGSVKEELSNDDDILPSWEGKIVAWLELEDKTVS